MAFPQKSSIVIFNSERHLRKTAGMQFCQWIVLAKSLAVFILGTSETDLFVAPPGLSRMGGLVKTSGWRAWLENSDCSRSEAMLPWKCMKNKLSSVCFGQIVVEHFFLECSQCIAPWKM